MRTFKSWSAEIADYLKGTAALNPPSAFHCGDGITGRLHRLQTVADQRKVTIRIDGEYEDVPAFRL